LILAIETATRSGSVALARGKETLYSAAGDRTASHSTDLIEIVEKTLKTGQAELSDVDLFAAAVGPGSFTGLRIGLATIKSFAACTGKRCVGVSTLAAIAHAAGASENTVALLPAGRGEVFAQLFSVDDGDVRALDGAMHITPKALLEKYGSVPRLMWAGDGAHLHVEALRAWAEAKQIPFRDRRAEDSREAGWVLAPRCVELAVSIAALALKEYRNGNTVSPDDLRAVYVRPSDAEINERWQQEKSLPPVLA
jgi:tRNA threonylcarbamoyladenosine biosynthesis protein TsaB